MKCEILAPAGSEQSARAALLSGADAVYLGLRQFSARKEAENFGEEEFSRIKRLAHLLGAKVYVALNTLVKESELADFFETAARVFEAGADAVLVQDLFLGGELKKRYPSVTLHLSTQGGCCNVYGARAAKDYGFSRAVLARETPLAEIERISKEIETEVFVQGALCTAFSGQCYLSSFAGGNSGNRGLCKQPCRKKYSVDRAGFSEPAYALSVSDLCVGRRVNDLLSAGVSSLKIEGRMRRAEYVGAAVKYYRALLDGENAEALFPALVRAYNRGDYTEGLAFGQREGFLSRKVQGHIGERVGQISFVRGLPFCASGYEGERGDGFKILRGGSEVGGASFRERGTGGFFLSSQERLKEGDEVRLTTCLATNRASLIPTKKRKISVELSFLAEKPAEISSEGLTFRGETCERAERAPLSFEQLADCFRKTDGLPFEPEISGKTDGVFLPKSALNGLRRAFYEALADKLDPARPPLPRFEEAPNILPVRGERAARILPEGEKAGETDILIEKPNDYRKLSPKKDVFLYLPPFFTTEELEALAPQLSGYAGIYCEGYYGIALAKAFSVPLFAGTGFNLTNRYAVNGVKQTAEFFALSKELSVREQDALSAEGAFALRAGAIKVMDLIYCPFQKTCSACDKKRTYRLTDEEGRAFPLRRYQTKGGCRFELFNCAELAAPCGLSSALSDGSASAGGTTKGHSERSML